MFLLDVSWYMIKNTSKTHNHNLIKGEIQRFTMKNLETKSSFLELESKNVMDTLSIYAKNITI